MKKILPFIGVLVVIIVVLLVSVVSLYNSNKIYKENEKNYENKIEYLEEQNTKLKENNNEQDVILEYDNKNINVSTNDEYDSLKEISVDEILKKVQDKESFIVLFSQPTCGHCLAFKPTFNKVLKSNKLISYEVNIYNLSSDERTRLYDVVKISGTPTTLVFENGEENLDYRMVGNLSEEKIIEKLKLAGYIK